MVSKHFGLLCGQGGDFTSVVDWLSPKMGHLFLFDTVTSFGVLDLSGMSSRRYWAGFLFVGYYILGFLFFAPSYHLYLAPFLNYYNIKFLVHILLSIYEKYLSFVIIRL